MTLRQTITWILTICALAVMDGIEPLVAQQTAKPGLIGRWDVTVKSANGATFPSWLEFEKSGRKTIVGRYVGQFGSARPISEVVVNGDNFQFVVPPQWEGGSQNIQIKGSLNGNLLHGELTGSQGEVLSWTAERAPALDHASPTAWGTPINLIPKEGLAGWKPQFPKANNGWLVMDGILTNAKPGNNLLTEQTFEDFQLLAEFRYPKGSNSGIYLRGRYEVQIEDHSGKAIDSHNIGGVYGFLTPSDNAALGPDQWQKLEVTLVGRRVTVVLNGTRVIDRQLIPGITGGALDSRESEPGPLMLQGDHGPVEFRQLLITPAAR